MFDFINWILAEFVSATFLSHLLGFEDPNPILVNSTRLTGRPFSGTMAAVTNEAAEGTMTDLAGWLRAELKERRLTQNQVAVFANVGQATISDMLNKGYVPKVETLFRLADFFGVSREQILRLAGHLPPASGVGDKAEADALVEALLAEFERVPDEWKPAAVQQIAQFRRLDELRPRIIGDEAEEERDGESGSTEAQAA
jgi:transcriptional regulator with XRE-family HTH domain